MGNPVVGNIGDACTDLCHKNCPNVTSWPGYDTGCCYQEVCGTKDQCEEILELVKDSATSIVTSMTVLFILAVCCCLVCLCCLVGTLMHFHNSKGARSRRTGGAYD